MHGTGAWCHEAVRDLKCSSCSGQGEGRSHEGVLSCRAVWSGVGIGPYDPATGGMCQCLPLIAQECFLFYTTNPRTYLPSPPTAWPHPAIWSCMISSAGRGMPWERQCRDAHTQTHTRTHIRLQPSASSAPLHALSFVSFTFFLEPC